MKKNKSWVILFASAVLLTASCFAAVFADDAVPGTSADPVVSKSYMDAQIGELQTQIGELQTKIEALQSGSSSQTQTPSGEGEAEGESAPSVQAPKFEVIRAELGQKIIAEASSEIILRSGSATAIAGESGGVSDVTQGIDLDTGVEVSKNHLLLIPVSDGRGIYCTSQCYVMVKGAYTLE